MSKISKSLIIIAGFLVVGGFWVSHFQVNLLSLEERTFQNLFITKMNSLESYILAITFILLAIYFKKND